MNDGRLYPRYVEGQLSAAIEDSPVILIHGPRQCGKTTLAQIFGNAAGYQYFSFDDAVMAEAAAEDPAGFIGDLPARAILDEVQHVPEVFSALKMSIDRERTPGRFILTGSANTLLVPRLADSLAGRMDIIRLHPLAQCELARQPSAFLDKLFGGGFRTGLHERLRGHLVSRIVAGGYPAALARTSTMRSRAWYRNYISTLIQRDVKDLSRIRNLAALPRLLSLIATQTAQLRNISSLAAPFQESRVTIHDYVTLLKNIFLIDILSPWHTNRGKRLLKTPKIHIGDTGVATSLMGMDEATLAADRSTLGRLAETFVFQELRRLASWHPDEIRFHHFRDKDGYEVDIVLERSAGEVVGVEVKASASIKRSDFAGLRKLQTLAKSGFKAGIVLYDGEACVSFGDKLQAVPLRMLWES